MSGMELATACRSACRSWFCWSTTSLTLIKATQQRRYAERYIAVDLQNPDFGQLAAAFGVRYRRADSDEVFERRLREALQKDTTTVIEVRPGDARGQSS